MMKVVIIGPAFPLRGGISAFNQRFAKELKSYQVDPIIYTFKLQYPSCLFPGKSQIDTDQIKHGIDIRPSINSINPINWIQIAKEIIDLKPDLIICRYWMPFFAPSLGSILRLIKRDCMAEIVALVDNLVPHERRLGDKVLTRYFMQPVDQFLVMSDKVKKDIQALGSDKPIIKLTHPAYDNYGTEVSKEEAINHLGLSPKMTYLLFFGFVRKYKGLDLLINALADPLLENRAISLIIAGEFYDREQKYRRLIASKNLSKRVILHPNYIPNHDVKYYFSASDLVVLPYRSASQSGICQIASHFTRPVLISNVGGLPEIIEDGVNGFISSPEPALLAKGIQRFFDLQDKKELNQNIRVANESFSWSSFTSSFLRQIGHDFHTDKKLDSLLSSGVGV